MHDLHVLLYLRTSKLYAGVLHQSSFSEIGLENLGVICSPGNVIVLLISKGSIFSCDCVSIEDQFSCSTFKMECSSSVYSSEL